MPQKTRARKIARPARKGPASNRSQGRTAVCGIGAKKADAAPVLADSLHSLTLRPIPTPDIQAKMYAAFPTAQKKAFSCEILIKDLWMCYRKAMSRLSGKKISAATDIPQLATYGQTLQAIVRQFQQDILPHFPEGSEFNIEQADEGHYYYTIYKVCKWESAWRVLDLKTIFKILRKQRHYALHEVMLLFVRAFHQKTGVGSYWGGTLEQAEFWLDDHLQQIVDDPPDPTDRKQWEEHAEAIDEIQKTMYSYRYGEAARYADKITSRPVLSTDQIRARLKRIRRDHPVKTLIEAGCWVMDDPFQVSDFCDVDDSADEEYLGYDLQACLIWDWDELTEQHTEYLDTIMNNAGTADPVSTFRIDATTRNWQDLDRFKASVSWPWSLYNFFELANQIVNKLQKHEPTNRVRVR